MSRSNEPSRLTLIKKKIAKTVRDRKGNILRTEYRGFYSCECGNKKWLDVSSVQSKKVRSCGCMRSESSSKRMKGRDGTSALYMEHEGERVTVASVERRYGLRAGMLSYRRRYAGGSWQTCLESCLKFQARKRQLCDQRLARAENVDLQEESSSRKTLLPSSCPSTQREMGA